MEAMSDFIVKKLNQKQTRIIIQNYRKDTMECKDIASIFRDHNCWPIFQEHFKRVDKHFDVRSVVHLIVEGRNRASHRPSWDLNPDFTQAQLFMIAEILSKIDRPTQQREVKAIRDNLFYDNTKDLLAEVEERIKKLESEKQEYEKRNVELSESLAEKSKSLQDAVSERDEHEKNTTELKKTKAEITKLNKELLGTKEELGEAKESIVDYKERLVNTAKELKDTKTSLLTSEESLSNKPDKQQEIEVIRDQLVLDHTENQISEISERLLAAENEKKELKKKLANTKRQLEKSDKENLQNKERIEELKNVEDEKKKSDHQVSKLQKEVREYEEKWHLSKENLKTANQRIKESKKEKKSLEERVTELEQQFEEVTKQNEDYKKRPKASEENLSNTSEKFTPLQEEKRDNRERTHATENELAKVKNENKNNNENISKRQGSQNKKVSQSSRWSGHKKVRDVVRDAVRVLTQDKTDVEFTIKDVNSVIHKTDSNFKNNTTGPQITQDCVNHPSRKHHTSKHNYYWRVERGKYRLFDPEKDKIEDLDDSIQT
ncbi:hypothetical protein F4X73_04860 [Candidatus Poribacteria bacterium]|nr:hypothetical protein [Candidatus Poribacteria bacterium]